MPQSPRLSWVVQDMDASGQPYYGPFPTQESADAFGSFLGSCGHDRSVAKIHDAEALRQAYDRLCDGKSDPDALRDSQEREYEGRKP